MTDVAAPATRPATTVRHNVRYRFSSSIFGRHFYVALVAGSETRSPGRLRDEGIKRRLAAVAFEIGVFCLAVSLMICLVIGVAVVGLYIVKCVMGIDLMDGPSPLHPIYEWLFER